MTLATATWIDVCPMSQITIDRGVAAVLGGRPIAVFVLASGDVFAIDHLDPFHGAPVMARGLIGSMDGTPIVASPLLKQRFELTTGRCLDADDVTLETFDVRIADDGMIQVKMTSDCDPVETCR